MILQYHMMTRRLRGGLLALTASRAVPVAARSVREATGEGGRGQPPSAALRTRVAAVLGERSAAAAHGAGAGGPGVRTETAGWDDHTDRRDDLARLVAHRRDEAQRAEVVLLDSKARPSPRILSNSAASAAGSDDRVPSEPPVRPLDDAGALGVRLHRRELLPCAFAVSPITRPTAISGTNGRADATRSAQRRRRRARPPERPARRSPA